MHLLPGPLISAIAEGERIEISFGPGRMFGQHVLGVYDGLMMLTSANEISILLMQIIQHFEIRLG